MNTIEAPQDRKESWDKQLDNREMQVIGYINKMHSDPKFASTLSIAKQKVEKDLGHYDYQNWIEAIDNKIDDIQTQDPSKNPTWLKTARDFFKSLQAKEIQDTKDTLSRGTGNVSSAYRNIPRSINLHVDDILFLEKAKWCEDKKLPSIIEQIDSINKDSEMISAQQWRENTNNLPESLMRYWEGFTTPDLKNKIDNFITAENRPKNVLLQQIFSSNGGNRVEAPTRHNLEETGTKNYLENIKNIFSWQTIHFPTHKNISPDVWNELDKQARYSPDAQQALQEKRQHEIDKDNLDKNDENYKKEKNTLLQKIEACERRISGGGAKLYEIVFPGKNVTYDEATKTLSVSMDRASLETFLQKVDIGSFN